MFNEDLTPFTREMMARKLYSLTRPKVFKIEKPKFPTVNNVCHILQLIGPNSWLMFSLLNLNADQEWMTVPAKYWNNFADYRKVRDFVKNMEVTNDCAERGVKIINDFKDIAQDEEQRQFALQVIAKHRQQVPTISKKNLSNQRIVLDQRTSRRRRTDVGAGD